MQLTDGKSAVTGDSLMNEKCFDCSHSKNPDLENYCYMFETAPNILPCGQHDKFKMERQKTGQLVAGHPEILAMMMLSGSWPRASDQL